MDKSRSSFNLAMLPSIILGIAAAWLVFAVLTGREVPRVVDDRAAFIALASIGFVMCAVAISRVANRLGWAHPITIAGAVLGTLLMLLVTAMLAGWQVPFITDYRAAFTVLAVVGLVKWALAWLARLRFGL